MAELIFRQPRFDALRNAIYHTARRNFFDRVNRCLNFLVIILGAGVAGKLAERLDFPATYLELSVVVAASAQLVFDFGSRARDHEFLQKKYYEFLSEIEQNAEPSISDLRDWNGRLFKIAGEEPLTMRALDAIAYNNALDAVCDDREELDRHRLNIRWYQYFFRHIFAFHSAHFH